MIRMNRKLEMNPARLQRCGCRLRFFFDIHRNLRTQLSATQCNPHGLFHNVLIGVQVAQPQMARAADTVVAARQYGPLMRQRVVVADQTYRVRIGLGLVLLNGIAIVGIIIGVGDIGVGGGGDLGGGELGRRVGTVGLAALPAVADHRSAGTAPAAAVPAAIAAAPATSAATAATGHAGHVSCVLLATY